jgi:hypothetical protein
LQSAIRRRPIVPGQRRISEDEEAPVFESTVPVGRSVEVLTCQRHVFAGVSEKAENQTG